MKKEGCDDSSTRCSKPVNPYYRTDLPSYCRTVVLLCCRTSVLSYRRTDVCVYFDNTIKNQIDKSFPKH
jgi:hypothetical protein